MKNSRAWIIIPVHNRRELTLACLHALRWCMDLCDWAIVIADDGSTDGTAEAIKTQFPSVHVIHGNGDWFWTGAIAAGMRHAHEHAATEYIWLNDDTIPDEVSLRRIVGLVRHDNHLMVASTAIHDERQIESCSMNFKGVLAQPGQLIPVDVLAGYQVAFSSAVIDTIGFPDPHKWPHYAGDSGYTRQACKAGFKLRLDGDSSIKLRDFIEYAPIEQVFWSKKLTLTQRLYQTFASKKSPFRLASRWHLDVLSRGTIHGSFFFLGRLLNWLISIIRSFPSRTPSVKAAAKQQ